MYPICKQICVTILVFLGLSGQLLAQKNQDAGHYIRITTQKYDIRNGLRNNNTLMGVVDQNDGLWLVSDLGLTFFDGKHSIQYSAKDSLFHIRNTTISDIVLHDKEVYVAHEKGIDVINVNSKISRPLLTEVQGSRINNLFVTESGLLFAILENGVILNVLRKSQSKIPFQGRHYYITETQNEHIIITDSHQSYAVFDSKDLKLIKTFKVDRSYSDYSNGITYLSGQGLLNYTINGIVKIDIENETEQLTSFGIGNIRAIYPIFDDQELILQNLNTLYLKRNNSLIRLDLNIPSYLRINDILVTKHGTVIILYSKGLIAFNLPKQFINVIDESVIKNEGNTISRRAILDLPDSTVLLTSYSSLQIYNPKSKKTKLIDDRLLLFVDGYLDGNTLVFGTDGNGLIFYDIPSRSYRTRRFIQDGDSEHIYAVYKDHRGSIILGYGVNPPNVESPYLIEVNPTSFDYRQINLFNNSIPEAKRIVNKISQDSRKHYWISTNAGLYELDPEFKILNHFSETAKESKKITPTDKINMVYHESDTTLWAATNSGIFKLNTVRSSISEGRNDKPILSGKRVTTIMADQNRNLWMGTFRGLSFYNTTTKNSYRFYQEDGFPEDEFNYYSYLNSKNSLMYLGGLNGVVELDPSKFEENKSLSQLKVNYILKESREGVQLVYSHLSGLKHITLTSSLDILNIYFSIPEYINTAYSNYYYSLDPKAENWIEEPSGLIRLWNLPNGNYTLHLKGIDPNGREFIEKMDFTISVRQPFYLSNTFQYLLILAGLVIIAVFMILRYLQTKEIRKVRSDLLNDIHDELGSVLTKTAMKAELMSTKYQTMSDDLLIIQRYCREGVQSLRNLLWSISSDTYTSTDFQDRITEWLNFFFLETRFEFTFTNHIPEEIFTTSIFTRRQILSIVKELATNTLKHSNGDHFYLNLGRKGNRYHLTVYDNGKNENKTLKYSGYGLKSVQMRVQELKGELSFDLLPNGFKTEIIF